MGDATSAECLFSTTPLPLLPERAVHERRPALEDGHHAAPNPPRPPLPHAHVHPRLQVPLLPQMLSAPQPQAQNRAVGARVEIESKTQKRCVTFSPDFSFQRRNQALSTRV
jgi:hypothetical protein